MARLSLLIANDSFTDPTLPGLIAPEKDARELRDLLRDERIGGFDETVILVNESKPEIERNIEMLFNRAGAKDLVCLYFSGHGVRDAQGDLYFVVTNTKQDLLWSTAISANALLRLVDRSRAASVVLLLDCCYSGAALKGMKSTEQSLEKVLSVGRGRCVLTASSQIETAQDGKRNRDGEIEHSAFTAVVVEGLRTGKADVDSDGLITPDDLWTYVAREMRERVPGQTPTRFGDAAAETHLARVSGGVHAELNPGAQVNLGTLVGRRSQTAERGYPAKEWSGVGKLIVPIGQVIEGGERQIAVPLNLGRDHLLVVGRIGSGKSTLLRTLVCGLSLTHTPDEVRFVFLESGGGQLGSLRRLPHYAVHASSSEATTLGRVFDRLEQVVEQRKMLFDEHFATTLEELRPARAENGGTHRDHPHPHVMVFVDRWADFAGVPGFERRLVDLASSGLDVGVHVVVSARSWGEVSDGLAELASRRIEFALAEPGTSRLDAAVAAQLARDSAGWAQTGEQRVRIALPSLEPLPTGDGAVVSDGATELVRHLLRSNADSLAVSWQHWAGLGTEPVLAVGVVEAEEPPTEAEPMAESPPRLPEPPPPTETPSAEPEPPLESSAPVLREEAAVTVDAPLTTEFREPEHPPLPRPIRKAPSPDPSPQVIRPRLEELLGLPASLNQEDFFLSRGNHRGGPLPLGVNSRGNQVTVRPFGKSTPGGLVVGGDKSGKDELVRTLLFGMVARYPASRLNLALMSYRSRTIFAGLGQLPHVVTAVEQLRDAPAHAERQAKLLRAEVDRRQAAAAVNEDDSEATPRLLVVLDEFNDLATEVPAFDAVIKHICRGGFQYGVHLLLAAHFVQMEDLAGFADSLSYRIALRCDDSSSRVAIGSTYAAELSDSSGAGFLRNGNLTPFRFTGATTFHEHQSGEPLAARLIRLAANLESPTERQWPEPLSESPELAELVGPLRKSERGLSVESELIGESRLPVGLVELTDRSRIEPLLVDFGTDSNRPANILITGPAASGKAQLAVTIMTALALTHTPEELRLYTLGPTENDQVARLPHFGGAATHDHQPQRMVAELELLVKRRAATFTRKGCSGFEEYLRSWREREVNDRLARIVVLVQGWDDLEAWDSHVDQALHGLATDGPQVGVHLIAVTGDQRSEADRIDEPLWSQQFHTVDGQGHDGRRIRDDITASGGCRGVVPGLGEFVAAPVNSLGDRIASAWQGPGAPGLSEIPDSVTVAELEPTEPGRGLRIPIGINALDREPATVDFGSSGHLLVVGSKSTEQSSFLITLLQQLARNHGTDALDTWPAQITVLSGSGDFPMQARTALRRVPGGKEYCAKIQFTDDATAATAVRRLWNRRVDGTMSRVRRLRKATAPESREFLIIEGYGSDLGIDAVVDNLWSKLVGVEHSGIHVVVTTTEPDAELAFATTRDRPTLLRLTESGREGHGFPPGWGTLTDPHGDEHPIRVARPATGPR